MPLRLGNQWWMGALTAVTGSLLLALNVRKIGTQGASQIALLSTGAAGFVTVLGWALTVQPKEEFE